MRRFRTILADPPWRYDGGCWDRKVSRASSHYDTLSIPEICSLPVPAAEDAYLFLWITSRHLLEGAAKAVMEAWGFRPLTTAVWCKPQMGLGYYLRNSHELVAFGVRGSPGPFKVRNRTTWFVEDRQKHSKKPDLNLEELTDGPYLELFAREERPGWTSWGLEVGDPLGIGFDPDQWSRND